VWWSKKGAGWCVQCQPCRVKLPAEEGPRPSNTAVSLSLASVLKATKCNPPPPPLPGVYVCGCTVVTPGGQFLKLSLPLPLPPPPCRVGRFSLVPARLVKQLRGSPRRGGEQHSAQRVLHWTAAHSCHSPPFLQHRQ
jgi:hypothetical protein